MPSDPIRAKGERTISRMSSSEMDVTSRGSRPGHRRGSRQSVSTGSAWRSAASAAMVRPANCGRCGEIEICTNPRTGCGPSCSSRRLDIGANFFARIRKSQPFQHRRHAAGLHPLRQEVLQRVRARRVRVGVAVDIEAARFCIGDHRRACCALPQSSVPEHLKCTIRPMRASLGDVDRLLHWRRAPSLDSSAEMGEIAGVMALQHTAEGFHLVRLCVGPGGVNRPDESPSAPAPNPSSRRLDHRVELGPRRRTVRHAHRHEAERVVADQHPGVDRRCRKAVEIVRKAQLAERRPRRRRRR